MAKCAFLLLSVQIICIVLIEYAESKHQDDKEKHKHTKHVHSAKSAEHNKEDQSIDEIDDVGWEYENTTKVDSRRILYSKMSRKGKRPYMVYLQLTKESAKAHKYRGWLCGGVIVDRYYVLTSAACVEDADHFYIVSGTNKWVDSSDYKNDDCVCKHRRKVVWKCIPKNYKFDFQDSIKWSSNDIAIVKVNKPFKLGICEQGCEFATDLICYNNISRDLEKPGTKGVILGWGSGSNFREGVYRRQRPYTATNAKCLQEAKVCLMDNEQCAKKWSQRFRKIITEYMICTKDVMKRLSEICDKRYANCTNMENRRNLNLESTDLAPPGEQIDLGRHLRDPYDYVSRRSTQGGFCENDHGGPLIVKYRNKDRVIGVISACKIDPKTHSCHGPFLYTSVFQNRQFIACSIYKDVTESCRRVFRSGITHEEVSIDWDEIKDDHDKADNRDDDDDDEATANSWNQRADDDSDETKILRKESSKEKTKPSKKESSSNSSSASSSSNESKEMQKSEGHDNEKKSEGMSKKDKKSKTKSEDNRHENSKKKASRRARKFNENGEAQERKEVFYESSRDENVNEPEEDE